MPHPGLQIGQTTSCLRGQAIVALAEQIRELPPTLSHRMPHGTHRIYRTPPGWTGRAWVGKDARNPLPAGIDLRVPGQILMAPPSRVPAEGGGRVSYGPVTGTGVADLPAGYATAWTPPQAAPRQSGLRVPVPAGRAGAAASYVQARINGIVADLAAREPGGRNTSIYTAALKVGSTLGAARSTPGAEQAAATWTDEAAEDALMAAAEQNGYAGKHGTAAARSAVRNGLRNGLRSPRPLPDFGSRLVGPPPEPRHPRNGPEASAGQRARARSVAMGQVPATSPRHQALPARHGRLRCPAEMGKHATSPRCWTPCLRRSASGVQAERPRIAVS